MTELRLSQCGVLAADGNQILWDGFLNHEQFALSADALRAIGAFRDWASATPEIALSCGLKPDRFYMLVEQLASAGILIGRDSREMRDESSLSVWDPWGLSAKHFHFSSRTLAQTRFTSAIDDVRRLQVKGELIEPPPIQRVTGGPVVDVPKLSYTDLTAMGKLNGYLDVLQARRSARFFDSTQSLTGLQFGGSCT